MGSPPGDGAGDLLEMSLHGLCVGVRHDEGGPGAAQRTNGAEQASAITSDHRRPCGSVAHTSNPDLT